MCHQSQRCCKGIRVQPQIRGGLLWMPLYACRCSKFQILRSPASLTSGSWCISMIEPYQLVSMMCTAWLWNHSWQQTQRLEIWLLANYSTLHSPSQRIQVEVLSWPLHMYKEHRATFEIGRIVWITSCFLRCRLVESNERHCMARSLHHCACSWIFTNTPSLAHHMTYCYYVQPILRSEKV